MVEMLAARVMAYAVLFGAAFLVGMWVAYLMNQQKGGDE